MKTLDGLALPQSLNYRDDRLADLLSSGCSHSERTPLNIQEPTNRSFGYIRTTCGALPVTAPFIIQRLWRFTEGGRRYRLRKHSEWIALERISESQVSI